MSWEGNWHARTHKHTHSLEIETSHWAAGFFTENVMFSQAQIIKILQAASSEQLVGFHRLVFHGFRWNHIFVPWQIFESPTAQMILKLKLEHQQRSLHILPTLSTGFSVLFSALDPVPQSLWASYHVFGLLSWGHGLCTAILTLTAAACVRSRQSCGAIMTPVSGRLIPGRCLCRLKAPLSCTTCPSAWRWLLLAAQVTAPSCRALHSLASDQGPNTCWCLLSFFRSERRTLAD